MTKYGSPKKKREPITMTEISREVVVAPGERRIVPRPSIQVLPPFVPAGEWVEVLKDNTGAYIVTLDRGSFLWAWDLIETRAQALEEYASRPSVSEDFWNAVSSVTVRVTDVFRDEASRHADTHRKPPLSPKAEEALQALNKAEAAQAKARKAKTKSGPKKKRTYKTKSA